MYGMMIGSLLIRCILLFVVVQVPVAFRLTPIAPPTRKATLMNKSLCIPLKSAVIPDPAIRCASFDPNSTLLVSPLKDMPLNTAPPMVEVESKKEANDYLRPSVSYGPHFKVKGAVLNMWGVTYALSLLLNSVLLLPSLFMLTIVSDISGDTKRRRALDWLIHLWARLSLKLPNLLLFNNPTVYGAHHLPSANEAVVYVPNHTTFFDILLLSGYIPRPFKYVSKIEISKIPIVGLAMKLARHVFLDRHNLNSAAECAETVHQRLLHGNSIALFAEGTRSSDGRLRPFKKGAFQMAKRASVKVVPISIGNLHRIMPSEAAMPLASLRHTYITIHPPIDTADKTVKEIQSACFEAVNAGLPEYQRYIAPVTVTTDTANSSVIS